MSCGAGDAGREWGSGGHALLCTAERQHPTVAGGRQRVRRPPQGAVPCTLSFCHTSYTLAMPRCGARLGTLPYLGYRVTPIPYTSYPKDSSAISFPSRRREACPGVAAETGCAADTGLHPPAPAPRGGHRLLGPGSRAAEGRHGEHLQQDPGQPRRVPDSGRYGCDAERRATALMLGFSLESMFLCPVCLRTDKIT